MNKDTTPTTQTDEELRYLVRHLKVTAYARGKPYNVNLATVIQKDDIDALMHLIKSHREQYAQEQAKNIKILGKSVDETFVILNGLELERITEIEVTMKNLNQLYKRLVNDTREANQKAISRAIEAQLFPKDANPKVTDINVGKSKDTEDKS